MRQALIASLVVLISGCTANVEELLPQDGPTMLEIYNEHLQRAGGTSQAGEDVLAAYRRQSTLATGQAAAKDDLLSYTRDVETEIDNLFPTLENPELVMHVFPHLATDERVPVPGYSTSFPMFERVEYALPGEVAPAESQDKSRPRIRVISSEYDADTPINFR